MRLLEQLQQQAVRWARTDKKSRSVVAYDEPVRGRRAWQTLQSWRQRQADQSYPISLQFITPNDARQLPRLLGLRPERAALLGGSLGATAGLLAALSGALLLPLLLGLTPMAAAAVLAAAVGLLYGGYYGALYGARWAAQPALQYKQALARGAVLIAIGSDNPEPALRALGAPQSDEATYIGRLY